MTPISPTFAEALNAVPWAVSDIDDKDRPAIRAEYTLNKHVVETLMVHRPATRRARVIAVIELIRPRVAEAYHLDDAA